MNILRFYVGKTVLLTSIMTLASLAVIRVLFSLIDQSGDFGKGSYQFLDGVSYALLLSPQYIYEFFPMAVLIGSIAGLGLLASRSELTVMRAVGISTWQIVVSALLYGLILISVSVVLGEWVAPKTTQMAEDLRHRAILGEKVLKNDSGMWLKDGNQMVYIEEVMSERKLKNVMIYRFNQQKMSHVIEASTANLVDGAWQLLNGYRSRIYADRVERERFDALEWSTEISLDHLSVLRLEPENLDIVSLNEYRSYLALNGLDTQQYDLAFWRKLFQPLSTAVMIILAASFIFGPMRTVSMGARVLVGVVTGMMYFFAVRTFGPVSLVMGLPAFLGAALPPLIFAVAALYLLRRAG